MSKFKSEHKTEILKAAYRAIEVVKKSHKLTSEIKSALTKLCEHVRDQDQSFEVKWTDQIGNPDTRTIGPISAKKMLTGLQEIVETIDGNKAWKEFGNSLEFALLMSESVDGIGPSRAMQFKALLDGCSREDAITLHVMQTVFAAGLKAWGDKPWEQSSGHTVWTPIEVINTLMLVYKFSPDEAKKLAKFLLELGLVGQYSGTIALPKIHYIESSIASFAESTYDSEEPLDHNSEGLTEEQRDLLHGIDKSNAKVVCIKGPGGTGKTHTISRHIRALLDKDISVLCCAPTGIAAKVLNDSLKDSDVETSALVGGSVIVLDRAIAFAKFGSLDADVLIVDEASMVSVEHLSVIGLLWSLKRLILLGDPSQLRPVEPGQPFMDLLENPSVEVLQLYTNMRVNGEKLAKELQGVRAGVGLIHQVIPMAASAYTKDHGILKSDPRLAVSKDMRDQLRRWVKSSVGKGYVWLAHSNAVCNALADLNLAMMLDYDEALLDDYTCALIGAYFGARPTQRRQRVSLAIDGLGVYWTGDREGDEERIYRGFKGTVNAHGFVVFEAITKEGFMTKAEYALEQVESRIMPWMVKTVHKSQGQTLTNVVYLIKAAMGGKHSLELAYTAHSRAKEDCIVVTLCNEKRNPKLTADSKRKTSIGIIQ
jgi:hypothetical protein